MNVTKKFCAAAAALVIVAAPFYASADTALDIPIRVEGPDGNVYFETVKVSDTDSDITAADALVFADKQSDKLEITGADTGYITEVNGTASGKFGGWDGWYFSVNGETPAVGVAEYTLKEGDSLTLYYGGFPCQIPYADTSKLESDGVIAFKSNDTEYDENWNATPVVNPVTDAEVTVNGEKFTTDKNGEIKLGTDKLAGDLTIQIEKKDATGAPAVLRFEPNYTIEGKADDNTDTASDTSSDEKDSDTDTDTSSDKSSDSDKDSDKSDSSKNGSSSSQSQSSNNTRSSAPAVTAAATAAPAAEAPAATGDGRTYLALGVFAAAAIIVLLMFVLGRKKNNE